MNGNNVWSILTFDPSNRNFEQRVVCQKHIIFEFNQFWTREMSIDVKSNTKMYMNIVESLCLSKFTVDLLKQNKFSKFNGSWNRRKLQCKLKYTQMRMNQKPWFTLKTFSQLTHQKFRLIYAVLFADNAIVSKN